MRTSPAVALCLFAACAGEPFDVAQLDQADARSAADVVQLDQADADAPTIPADGPPPIDAREAAPPPADATTADVDAERPICQGLGDCQWCEPGYYSAALVYCPRCRCFGH